MPRVKLDVLIWRYCLPHLVFKHPKLGVDSCVAVTDTEMPNELLAELIENPLARWLSVTRCSLPSCLYVGLMYFLSVHVKAEWQQLQQLQQVLVLLLVEQAL